MGLKSHFGCVRSALLVTPNKEGMAAQRLHVFAFRNLKLATQDESTDFSFALISNALTSSGFGYCLATLSGQNK